MDVQINYDYRGDDLKDMPLVELAQFVLDHQEKPQNTEVSLSFVTDGEIARLNEQYRGKEGPTDVLSFECDGVEDELSDMVPAGLSTSLGTSSSRPMWPNVKPMSSAPRSSRRSACCSFTACCICAVTITSSRKTPRSWRPWKMRSWPPGMRDSGHGRYIL